MALQAAEFIHPDGELREEMFPEEDLTANLTKWIEDAEGRTSDLSGSAQEKAQRKWVYHRAYAALYRRLRFAMPQAANLKDQGDWEWSEDQVQDIGETAEDYRREFEALARPAEVPPAPSFRTRRPRRPGRRRSEYSASRN